MLYCILCSVNLVIASRGSPAEIYTWSDEIGQFNTTWRGHPLLDLYPIKVVDENRPEITMMAEAKPENTMTESPVQNVYQSSMLSRGQSDYVPRYMLIN